MPAYFCTRLHAFHLRTLGLMPLDATMCYREPLNELNPPIGRAFCSRLAVFTAFGSSRQRGEPCKCWNGHSSQLQLNLHSRGPVCHPFHKAGPGCTCSPASTYTFCVLHSPITSHNPLLSKSRLPLHNMERVLPCLGGRFQLCCSRFSLLAQRMGSNLQIMESCSTRFLSIGFALKNVRWA